MVMGLAVLGCGGDPNACEQPGGCEGEGTCAGGGCETGSDTGGQPSASDSSTTAAGSTGDPATSEPETDTATTSGQGSADGPSIDMFLADGQAGAVEVFSPGNVTVTWQASGVSSCTASAEPAVEGWSGAQPLSGELDLVVDQDTVLALNCDALVETLDITYTLQCDASVHPPGLTMVEDVYANINDGFPFGESTNASFLLNIWNTQFVSLSDFSLPTAETSRRIVFVDAPTSHNHFNTGTVSISECPGDFSETATCVLPVHNNATLFISTRTEDPFDGQPTFCRLDPRRTYYINYVTSPDPFNEPPSCNDADDDNCAMFYSESL